MNEWKSSGGRITMFPAEVSSHASHSALELFKQVWSDEPSNFQKPANPLMPTVAQGKRGILAASCTVQPTRTDFTLTPSSPQEPIHGSFPLIENTHLLHAELLRIMDAIDQGVVPHSAVRVALGVQFLALGPSSAEANRALTAVIPDRYGVRLTDEEDFIFQINRPYPSRNVEGVKMNSLTKWSVDRLQVLTISLPAGGAATPAQASASARPQTETFIAASVNFDINNIPTERVLLSRQTSLLLHEALNALGQWQQAIGLKIDGF